MVYIHYFHGKIVTHHCSDWSTNHFCWRWSCVLSSPVFPFHSVLNKEYNIKVILSPSILPSLSTVECITFVLVSFCDQKQLGEERVYVSLHFIATIKSRLVETQGRNMKENKGKLATVFFSGSDLAPYLHIYLFLYGIYTAIGNQENLLYICPLAKLINKIQLWFSDCLVCQADKFSHTTQKNEPEWTCHACQILGKSKKKQDKKILIQRNRKSPQCPFKENHRLVLNNVKYVIVPIHFWNKKTLYFNLQLKMEWVKHIQRLRDITRRRCWH